MAEFIKRYENTRKKKHSTLCISLDPGLKEFRGKDVIPERYMEENISESILNFCLDIVEKTSRYAAAYKINSQYVLFTLGFEQLRKLNQRIHKKGCISILDHKLGDIGSSNEAACYWTKRAGFDALTYSPFPGNIKDATKCAHKQNLGIFVLTLMSNPEAEEIQKKSILNEKPLYQWIAQKSKECNADGLVVGATGHITSKDIGKLREIVGGERIFLCPGIGAQKGEILKITSHGGNILMNVGRAIIYSQDPKESAAEFRYLFSNS